jgi:hypothetical protein
MNYTHQVNPVTREHPKPIGAFVNPVEHLLEPNSVNQRQPTSTSHIAERPSEGWSVRELLAFLSIVQSSPILGTSPVRFACLVS